MKTMDAPQESSWVMFPLFERIQVEFSEVYPWNLGAPMDPV